MLADGYLKEIRDKNNNSILLNVDSSTKKIQNITDSVGRVYSITYDQDLIRVTNPMGKSIVYTFANNLLTKVTDLNGNVTEYEYTTDANKNLKQIKNTCNGVDSTEKIDYTTLIGEAQSRVSKYTDVNNNEFTYDYVYNVTNYSGPFSFKIIITDKNGRSVEKDYGKWMYVFVSRDSEGKVTY